MYYIGDCWEKIRQQIRALHDVEMLVGNQKAFKCLSEDLKKLKPLAQGSYRGKSLITLYNFSKLRKWLAKLNLLNFLVLKSCIKYRGNSADERLSIIPFSTGTRIQSFMSNKLNPTPLP